MRGVPPCILQVDLTGKRAEAARGTIIAAVLEGGSKSSNLVVTSYYDQKPFYMITHSTPSVTWVELSERIYSHKAKTTVDFNFLRFNMSNEYNFEMNDNDVADQYRLVYIMQRFQRNPKWWWALWLWGMEVSLVNAFMMMRRYCKLKGVKQKIDHHKFNELIGRALLEPVNEWPKRYKKNEKTESGKKKGPPTATR